MMNVLMHKMFYGANGANDEWGNSSPRINAKSEAKPALLAFLPSFHSSLKIQHLAFYLVTLSAITLGDMSGNCCLFRQIWRKRADDLRICCPSSQNSCLGKRLLLSHNLLESGSFRGALQIRNYFLNIFMPIHVSQYTLCFSVCILSHFAPEEIISAALFWLSLRRNRQSGISISLSE